MAEHGNTYNSRPTTPMGGEEYSSGASTPERGRGKYPGHLARGANKPYLHRRGTSKTLESMADVLREAGYKETRVVTPAPPDTGAVDGDEPRGVIGFLATLVATRSLGRAAGRQVHVHVQVPTFKIDPPADRPTDTFRPTVSTPSARPPLSSFSSSSSAAAKNLRHVVSTPSLRKHSRRKRPAPAPPLPPLTNATWLASLTKALARNAPPAPSPLGDRTNASRVGSSSTPSPIRIVKPRPAQGAVSRTNVTCRSTPASRSSSLARRNGGLAPPPVLGLTKTENDPLNRFSVFRDSFDDLDNSDFYGDDSFMDDPEDEDEHTPVTLAHILAPRTLARRQRSIVSLRRNLQNMTPAVMERVGTWGATQVDDDGFPVLSPTQPPAHNATRRRGAMPTWGPDDDY